MADRRRCCGGAGHHTLVDRARATSRDSGSHGDHGERISEAREGREMESEGHRRRGELRRGRALSGERFGLLERLTCAKKARPSTRKPMWSSERWKEALGGGGASGTRRRELGELRWRATVRCSRAEARERGRKREGAHGVEARMASVLVLSTGGGAGHGVGERACRPHGVAGLTRSGARGAAVSERGEGGGRGCGEAGLASLAGPVGWRRPTSEQPPLPFFFKLFFQRA